MLAFLLSRYRLDKSTPRYKNAPAPDWGALLCTRLFFILHQPFLRPLTPLIYSPSILNFSTAFITLKATVPLRGIGTKLVAAAESIHIARGMLSIFLPLNV